MDTSKFSLKNIVPLLKPHLDHLPFRKLKDYIGNMYYTEIICGTEYRFEFYPGNVMVRFGLTPETRVRAIRLWQQTRGYHSKGHHNLAGVSLGQLLLERNNDGGVGGVWHYQYTELVPDKKLTNTFYSSKTEVRTLYCESDLKKIVRPREDFAQKFAAGLVQWINESNMRRTETTRGLEGLVDQFTPQLLGAT